MLSKWPRAKVINLTNSTNFLTTCRTAFVHNQSGYWNVIKGPDWPNVPPNTIQEIQALPQNIQDELKYQFEDQVYNNVEHAHDDVRILLGKDHQWIFTWDCDWYLDEESTVQAIKNIYDLLGLKDFDPLWVKLYWSKWFEKLNLLQNYNE